MLNRLMFVLAAGAGVVFLAPPPALAQPATTTSPATAPAVALRVKITEVVGLVRFRTAEDKPWQKPTVGMELDAGAEFQTAARSYVKLYVPPDQEITLDRMGSMTVLDALGLKSAVKIDLGLKYGRTDYKVQLPGVEHQTTIRSPGATLSVRGTYNMTLTNEAGFVPVATASQPVSLKNTKGNNVGFGRNGRTTKVKADKESAGEEAMSATKVDPAGAFAARTQDENAVLSYLTRVAPDLDLTQYELLRLAVDPNFKGTVAAVLPTVGELQITLGFVGRPLDTQIDLTVTSPVCKPACEVVSAANPKVPSGGIFTGTGLADKTGTGSANVHWGTEFPQGTYQITTELKRGGPAKPVFVLVQANPSSQNPPPRSQQFQFSLTPNNPRHVETIKLP
jgi:hypothetical protein